MIYFAFFALIIWLPIVFYIFEVLPGPKAAVFSFVFAWLFLPTLSIDLKGIPDWSKMTATTFSVTLIACLKHAGRLGALKFRWFDLPVLVYCVCPIISSLSNSQGIYDGLSACLEELFRWGLPYLIGRMFLGDLRGNYLLCLGIAIGGLIYSPLCLFEIRMSPILKLWVYGYIERSGLDFATRYGGFRPIVFLSFGLELGWWMCCASLACFNLWGSGAVKRLRGYPMSVLTLGIVLVTIACKSTGALVLIFGGYLAFTLSRRTKTTFLVWALLAVSPLYCVSRPLGLWDGSSLVQVADSVFGPERAQSLGYRFDQEEVLMRSAMQRPIFGWSRSGGFNPPGPDGKTAVTDGLWIIVFGTSGYVGLGALNAMLILPAILFMHRFRPRDWLAPNVAPTLTLATILPLYMIDNLSNAMLNPVYALVMGAVSGFVPGRQPAQARRRSQHSTAGLLDRGQSSQVSRRDGEQTPTYEQLGDEHEAAAVEAAQQARHEEAWELFTSALEYRQAAVDLAASPFQVDRLARTAARFARFLSRVGYFQFAIEQRLQAVQLWRSLLMQQQMMDEVLPAHASNLNDLAWLLVMESPGTPEQLAQAGSLAEEAVQIVPEMGPYWNTLGIAYYRQQEYYKAIRTLSQSINLADDGGNAFDFYYLALANHALGYSKPSRDWLEHAETWAGQHPELASPLQKIQHEVTQVLDLPRRKQRV